MDKRLLKALRLGDEEQIRLFASENGNLFTARSPQGNTVLHLAARWKKKSVVEEILKIQPSLLLVPNKKKETPMHIAAKAGDYGVVSAMCKRRTGGPAAEMILRMKDNEDNTPLHNALRNNNETVAGKLIQEDLEPIYYVNKAGQSPLSIAIDLNLTKLARLIIRDYPSAVKHKGADGLTLLHSAVIRQDYDVMRDILQVNKELIKSLDEHERNPLHYAAASGNVEIATHLSEVNASLAYDGDCEGQTPVHLAARNGRLNVLEKLLEDLPDTIEVLDKEQKNILHMAAENGDVGMVLFILKLPEMEDLINSPDVDGNTPLHLAAKKFHSNVVQYLSHNPMTNIKATNNAKKTPLEIVESSRDNERAIEKHFTIKALKAAYETRALNLDDIRDSMRISEVNNKNPSGKGKEMAQTLSVMATLIATFTFTAAFTIPGGYNSDGQDKGMAVFVRKSSFQAFVIADTIAMTSSMTAAVVVFWSFWRRKNESVMDTLPLAIGLTWIGLLAMAVAFVTGLFVVLATHLVLAIVVCCIGSALPLIFYVFAPFLSLLFRRSSFATDEREVNPFVFSWHVVKILVIDLFGLCCGRRRLDRKHEYPLLYEL